MRTTKSVVVARTDEMKIPSGRENKRETMSKLPIDETILAMWQRHNSLMGVYQRITRLSKQASSLNVGKSLIRGPFDNEKGSHPSPLCSSCITASCTCRTKA